MALSSALRREGKRLASLTAASSCSLKSLTASSPFALSKAEEVHAFGTRSISTQIVRNRMKSVKSIQKITKAMKMVASSKLRAIQTKTENSRGLWKPFTALVGDVPDLDAKKYIVITVTSDKGLCGGINSTCAKISKALAKIESGPEKEVKHIILGEKGKALFVRDSKKDMSLSITEMQKNPLNFTQVSVVVDDILKNLEFDAIKIVFKRFQSIVKFEPTIAIVLSLEALEKESDTGGILGRLEEYELEGAETKAEIYQNLRGSCKIEETQVTWLQQHANNFLG